MEDILEVVKDIIGGTELEDAFWKELQARVEDTKTEWDDVLLEKVKELWDNI